MGHYKSNVRDLEFNMFEVLRMNEALDAGEFGDMDTETAKGILTEVATLSEGPVAASFASADRNPPVFDPETHSVSLPEDFKKILTVPKNAITKQQKALLETEGVTVEFTDDAIDEIAGMAFLMNEETENIGARRLYTIMEMLQAK